MNAADSFPTAVWVASFRTASSDHISCGIVKGMAADLGLTVDLANRRADPQATVLYWCAIPVRPMNDRAHYYDYQRPLQYS